MNELHMEDMERIKYKGESHKITVFDNAVRVFKTSSSYVIATTCRESFINTLKNYTDDYVEIKISSTKIKPSEIIRLSKPFVSLAKALNSECTIPFKKGNQNITTSNESKLSQYTGTSVFVSKKIYKNPSFMSLYLSLLRAIDYLTLNTSLITKKTTIQEMYGTSENPVGLINTITPSSNAFRLSQTINIFTLKDNKKAITMMNKNVTANGIYNALDGCYNDVFLNISISKAVHKYEFSKGNFFGVGIKERKTYSLSSSFNMDVDKIGLTYNGNKLIQYLLKNIPHIKLKISKYDNGGGYYIDLTEYKQRFYLKMILVFFSVSRHLILVERLQLNNSEFTRIFNEIFLCVNGYDIKEKMIRDLTFFLTGVYRVHSIHGLVTNDLNKTNNSFKTYMNLYENNIHLLTQCGFGLNDLFKYFPHAMKKICKNPEKYIEGL